MKLSDLEGFQDIVIQCHDFPDADAIASGYALYYFFKGRGKDVRLIYSGRSSALKSNLQVMIQELHIPLEYVKADEMQECELLLTVDCQYGEGNVTKLPGRTIAMIDHHECAVQENEWTEIQSNYGGCSTLVYKMLQDEECDVNANRYVATALYYGLYMDTNGFGEVRNPYDMDLMEDMLIYENIVDQMKNANFTVSEMQIAGDAMADFFYDEKMRYAVVEAKPCDPNILGIISDFTLQVDRIDISIVYTCIGNGYKLSIRNCSRMTTANELAEFITRGIGNGGGHKNKAGGFINQEHYKEKYPFLSIGDYLKQAVPKLFESFDLIDVEKDEMDTEGMVKYRKLPIEIGYVITTDLAEQNIPLLVRTREGDIHILADQNTVLMIGVRGEIYPVTLSRFEKDYDRVEGNYIPANGYAPKVKNMKTGESQQLESYVKLCRRHEGSCIYARRMNRLTKLFTQWDYDNYMYGEENDLLAMREDDETDVFIIQSDVFEKTYEPVEN